MKDFLSLAKTRCSIRRYKDEAVEEEKIQRLVEAGRVAPSACNLQPWRFLVLDNKESMEKLGKACKTFRAPLAIVVLGDNNECWVRPVDASDSLDIDTSIAASHIVLEAEELGLSSCWVCNFNPSVLRSEFKIPGHISPVHVLILGYADCDKKDPERHKDERKALEELIIRNSF